MSGALSLVHSFSGLLFSGGQRFGIPCRSDRAFVARRAFQTGLASAGADLLVPLLGHDRIARAARNRGHRRPVDHRLDGTPPSVFGGVSHSGRGFRIVLALCGHRLDLSLPTLVPHQSLLMNSHIVPPKTYVTI